ncbi:hypothetical protein PV326_008227 [Microctonus aethiopoides]|nr:hypothetical protein PV326_008227 [Microctonus aethiopoides]
MAENNCDDENVKVKRMKISEADHQNLSINDFPDECLLEIFSWFQPGELLQVDKVCQRWESLCEQLWKKMTKISSKYGRWTIDHIIWYEIDSKTHVNHMKKLLKRCGKYVTHFNTSNLFSKNASNITKNLLTTVPQLCKNLTSMQIFSDDLSSVEMQTIAKNLENLIELEIGWLDEKLELDFCKILENNKNLKKLIINSKLDEQMISRLTGKFLQYLSPHVEKICLDKTYYNRDSYSFITAFRKFKCLQLFQCEGIFDYAMMQALTKNRSLIMLSLSSAEFKSPMRSINTLGNLVNLKKLSLSFVQQLEDDNLIHISNNCKQLKALNINSCYEITDTGIVSIANLSKLESLNMGNLDIVTDDSIGNLSGSLGRLWCFEALNQIVEEVNRTRSSCDQIEILTGKTDYESYESPLGALIVYTIVPQLCKNLTSMQIISDDLSSVEIQIIAKNLENLIELEIRYLDEELESDFCKILGNNKNLKKLIINSKRDGQMTSSLTGKFLQYLSPHVEKIFLDQTYYNRDSYSFITAFRKFKCLQLFQCEGIFDYTMMQALTKNRSLIKLSLSSAEFKSPMRSINTLGNLVNLKKLDLSFVQQLEDDNLIHISHNCKQLKALNIEFCENITDKGIVSIANLPKLESLNMGNLDIVTDDSIGNLSGSLEYLWCVGCPNIKNVGVIKLIRKSLKLCYINLIDTSATEALHQIVEEVNRTRSSCDQIEILTGKTDYESNESPRGPLIFDSDDEDQIYFF